MSVRLVFQGGLGSHLTQYVLARTIAERLQLGLSHELAGPRTAVDKYSSSLEPGALPDVWRHFPNAPLNRPGRHVLYPIEVLMDRPGDAGTWSVDGVVGDCTLRHIVFKRRCQDVRVAIRHIAAAREWFASPSTSLVSDGDVVVHVHQGLDACAAGRVLPLSFYDRALAGFRAVDTIHVCGVGIDDRVATHFQRHAVVVHELAPIDQFQLVRSAKRIILSNGRLASWAALLSDALEVAAPTGTGLDWLPPRHRIPGYRELGPGPTARVETDVVNHAIAYWRGPDGRSVVVQIEGKPPIQIRPSVDEEELLLWLLGQTSPVSVGDIRRRFGQNLRRTGPLLVESGVLSFRYRIVSG